jgi:hypothetical protein
VAAFLLAAEIHVPLKYRAVYVMGMADRLDQYLASRITSKQVMWVVIDPAKADTVLTDTLDDRFWLWVLSNYPPKGDHAAAAKAAALLSRQFKSSRWHRGTIFLVDPRSQLVLWSARDFPRNTSPEALDDSAARLANRLRDAFGH